MMRSGRPPSVSSRSTNRHSVNQNAEAFRIRIRGADGHVRSRELRVDESSEALAKLTSVILPVDFESWSLRAFVDRTESDAKAYLMEQMRCIGCAGRQPQIDHLNNLAVFCIRAGDYDDADMLLGRAEDALAAASLDAETHRQVSSVIVYNQCVLDERRGDVSGAIERYKKLLVTCHDHVDAWLGFARLLDRQGYRTRAIAALEAAAEAVSDPVRARTDTTRPLLHLPRLLAQCGRFEQARAAAHTVISASKSTLHQNPSSRHLWSNAAVALGTCYYEESLSEPNADKRRELLKRAFSVMLEVMHEDGDNVCAAHNLACCMMAEALQNRMPETAQGLLAAAQTLLTRVQEFTPPDGAIEGKDACCTSNRAHVALMQRDYAKAGPLFKALLDAEESSAVLPDRWELEECFANCLSRLGKHDVAHIHYAKVVAAQPDRIQTQVDYACSLVARTYHRLSKDQIRTESQLDEADMDVRKAFDLLRQAERADAGVATAFALKKAKSCAELLREHREDVLQDFQAMRVSRQTFHDAIEANKRRIVEEAHQREQERLAQQQAETLASQAIRDRLQNVIGSVRDAAERVRGLSLRTPRGRTPSLPPGHHGRASRADSDERADREGEEIGSVDSMSISDIGAYEDEGIDAAPRRRRGTHASTAARTEASGTSLEVEPDEASTRDARDASRSRRRRKKDKKQKKKKKKKERQRERLGSEEEGRQGSGSAGGRSESRASAASKDRRRVERRSILDDRRLRKQDGTWTAADEAEFQNVRQAWKDAHKERKEKRREVRRRTADVSGADALYTPARRQSGGEISHPSDAPSGEPVKMQYASDDQASQFAGSQHATGSQHAAGSQNPSDGDGAAKRSLSRASDADPDPARKRRRTSRDTGSDTSQRRRTGGSEEAEGR